MRPRFLAAAVWLVSAAALAAQAPVTPPVRDARRRQRPLRRGRTRWHRHRWREAAGPPRLGVDQRRHASQPAHGDRRRRAISVCRSAGGPLHGHGGQSRAIRQMSYGAKQPFRTGSGVMLAEGQQITDLQFVARAWRGADRHGVRRPRPADAGRADHGVGNPLQSQRRTHARHAGHRRRMGDVGRPRDLSRVRTPTWRVHDRNRLVLFGRRGRRTCAERRGDSRCVPRGDPDRQHAAAGPDCGAGASGPAALQLHAGLLPECGRPARGRHGEDCRRRRTQRHGPAHAVPSDGAHRSAGDGTRRSGG